VKDTDEVVGILRLCDDFVAMEAAKGWDEAEVVEHYLVPEEAVASAHGASEESPRVIYDVLPYGDEATFVCVVAELAAPLQGVELCFDVI